MKELQTLLPYIYVLPGYIFAVSTILMISLPFKLSGSFRFHKRGSNG